MRSLSYSLIYKSAQTVPKNTQSPKCLNSKKLQIEGYLVIDSGHFDTLYIALGLYPVRPGIFWTFLDPRGRGPICP